MNSKFFVPFETAKLLKKRGYPQAENDWYYEPAGEMLINEGVAELLRHRAGDNADGIVAAPTYHEVVDWLAGKGIRIEVRMAYHFRKKQWSWCGYVYVVEDEDYETSQLADWCSTREAAINAAILKALEML